MLKDLLKKYMGSDENAAEKQPQKGNPDPELFESLSPEHGGQPEQAPAAEPEENPERVMLCIYIPEGVFDEEELDMAGFERPASRFDELYDQLKEEERQKLPEEVIDLEASRMDEAALTADVIQYFAGELSSAEPEEAAENVQSMFRIRDSEAGDLRIVRFDPLSMFAMA